MKSLSELRKNIPAMLLAAFMASVMLPGCSSTEETSSGGSETNNCDQALSSEERQRCLEQLGK